MKHLNNFKKLLSLLLLFVGVGMLTTYGQYSRYAVDDAVIFKSAPERTANDQASTNIFVAQSLDSVVIALVKFDISGLENKVVTDAAFSTRASMSAEGKVMTVKLTPAGNEFSRDTTSWSNKPSTKSDKLASVELEKSSARKVYTTNGTALADYINGKLLNGDTEVSFAIRYESGDSTDLSWMGGAGDGSYGPLLELQFASANAYYAVDDATVFNSAPELTANDKAATNIFVAGAKDSTVYSFVKFNLKGLAYKQIGEAEFSTRASMNAEGKTMTVKLTAADNGFSRDTTTWNNKPSSKSDKLASAVLEKSSARKVYTPNGTTLVDYINGKLATGAEMISFAIKFEDGDSTDLSWMGGKGDGSYGPMLMIDEVTTKSGAYSSYAIDDAVIFSTAPERTANDQANTNIFVAKSLDSLVIALVKFDISGLANKVVIDAAFSTRASMSAEGKTMTVKLTPAENEFSRDTTSWSNKPSTKSDKLASVVLEKSSARKVYTPNGTALVDYINGKLLNGDTEASFAIRFESGDSTDLSWMGGAGDGSYGPLLELTFGEQSSYYGIDDATVFKSAPDLTANDKAATNIFVAGAVDSTVFSLVKFSLDGYAYSAIEDAVFSTRASMKEEGKTMIVNLTAADNGFSRDTTTWNNKPSTKGDPLASVVLEKSSARKEYVPNGSALVDYINSKLAMGQETISFAIKFSEGDSLGLSWMGGIGDGSYGPMLELTSPSLTPDSETFTVVEDVYVDEADPDANFDGNSDMGIRKADDGTSNEVYLKFNISEAADAVAGNVDLRLYIAQHNSGTERDNFYAEVYAIETSEWDETTLTWNTKPEAGKKLLEGNVTWYNAGKDTLFMGADLTHYFNEAVAAGMEYITLAIKGKDNTPGDRLWMAESNWKPEATQLLVDYTVEPPEKVIPVVADAHVEQGDPDTNFEGPADQHLINDDSNNLSKWIFQKFDISTAYEDVISATLSVYASVYNQNPDPSISEITFQVYGVADSEWIEDQITWNNKPDDEGTVLLEGIAKSSGQWFDLTTAGFTEYVNAAISAGKDSLSLVIKAKEETPGNRAWVSSRAWRAPKLVLNYEKQAVAPRFVTAPGEYIGSVDVELATLTSGATIYYTLDDTPPTDASTQYTGPITITDTTTVNAIAYAPDLKESPVVTGRFNVTPAGNIEFSLSPVPKYQPPIEVAITAEPEDAVIRYSDDGSDPTTIYTEPLIIEQTTTLKVQAFSADFTYSTEIVEVTYTVIPPTGTAGTGPGGVGFKDLSRSGQPELGLWLKPEMLKGFSDGDDILEWPDASGNENLAYNTWEDGGNNSIPETGEEEKQPPVFRNGALNGLPVAEMGLPGGDRTNGSLIIDDADNLDGGEGQSIFMVMKRNEIFEDFAALYQKRDIRGGDPAKQAYVLEMNGGADPNTMQYVITRDIFVRTDRTFNADDYYLLNTGLNGDLGLSYFIVNGSIEKTVAYDKPINAVAATAILGGFQAINVAEVAYFNSTLNAPQTFIVHEYLAAKYGMSLESGNRYTNTEYTSDLIGIGKDKDLASGKDEEHLHSTGGALELKADNFTNPGDYVLAAHNGAEITEDENKVWSRMWYVQTAGNGGNVTLTFDFAKAGLTLDAADGYILAHRASMDNDWADLELTPTKDGDKLVFTVSAIQDGYYAVGKALPGTVSVDRVQAEAAFNVYPNPAAEQVTVSMNNDKNSAVTLTIYDLSGRVAASSVEFKTATLFETTIDISSLDRGMYMIEVKQGDNKSIRPLVVK